MPVSSDNMIFRVKPRLLRLLGDQLIRDANVAVFELVKNAYDADAPECTVTLSHPDNPARARIEIIDTGSGMDENILRNVWMMIGTDFRAEQRAANIRTPRFNRFPLGEKGLGRLSVHKLGRLIRLITRVEGGDELMVEFDWDRLEAAEDLRHAGVILERRKPETFPGKKHGTKVEVAKLRETWKRGELRRLYRAVNSLCSPYKGPDDFKVSLSAPGCEDWLKDMFNSEEANGCAVYHVKGWFEGTEAQFEYEFKPPAEFQGQLNSRKASKVRIPQLEKRVGRKSIALDLGSEFLSEAAVTDMTKLKEKLSQPDGLVAKFLLDKMSSVDRQKLVAKTLTPTERRAVEIVILKELNEIIAGPVIFDERRFASVALSERTRQLLEKEDKKPLQKRLNRLLLADAFSQEISSGYEIGKVDFEFWLFDRDSAVLKAVTNDVTGLKTYLDENGGLRIYRDGIRVYDFGEPGNDWLNLDLRRVNTPTARTSNNQILGVLRLDATQSSDLREKSNREGFIETQAYADFRDAVISVLTNVEAEKTKDQKRLKEVLGKGTGQKIFTKLSELRETLEDKGVLAEVEPKLKAVERELELYRDQLLHAAVPGLSIGVMLHGAEKILDELREAARRGSELSRIRELVDRLYRAMRPVTNLLKNPAVAKTSASVLIKEAIFSTELRLNRHGINLYDGTKHGCADFKVEGSKQMLVASISNLIDNAIHWLDVREPSKSSVEKLLLVSTTEDLEGGPAIVVADNGPGFGNDDPEDLKAPFFSRRNGGMGLGLYIVDEVMRVNKGKLEFPGPNEIELPDKYDGAVVALKFPQSL